MSQKIVLPETGMFITLEGGEGSGKSTIIKHLKLGFERLGVDVTTLREPGGTDFSESVRNVFMTYDNLSPATSVHLMNAQRQDNLEKIIIPAMNKGHVVIADRYTASTLVYQGILNDRYDEVVELMQDIPQKTIFVDVRPEIGLERIRKNNRETNHFDEMGLDKHQRVYEGYHKLAELLPYIYWDHTLNGEKPRTVLEIECYKLSRNIYHQMKKKRLMSNLN